LIDHFGGVWGVMGGAQVNLKNLRRPQKVRADNQRLPRASEASGTANSSTMLGGRKRGPTPRGLIIREQEGRKRRPPERRHPTGE